MTVQDHLRVASAELRRASDTLRREISALRTEESNLKRLTDEHVARMTDEIRLREREIRSGSDVNDGNAQRHISNLRNEISARQREFSDDRRRIGDLIRRKQNDIGGLDAESRSIAP